MPSITRRTKIILAGAGLAALLGAGVGVGIAESMDDDRDTPITGRALDRSTAAALEHVGEGRVSDTEAGDEEGAYEVEVTLDDGSQVDVHLDEQFEVLGTEPDTEPDTEDDTEHDDDSED